MSALDRVRAKFSNAYVGDQQKQQKSSAGSAASSHTHSETHGHPSAGSAVSLRRDSEKLRLTQAQPVRCHDCRHFEPRPGEQPDGWCVKFVMETWATVLFACGGYAQSEAARQLEARRQKVTGLLHADPALKYSFDVQGASPIGQPAGAVSVMLGMRDSSGTIVTGELAVPPEKWDMAAFIAYWDSQPRPS